MFVRKGQALGSVRVEDVPADEPKPKPKTAPAKAKPEPADSTESKDSVKPTDKK